METDPKAPNTKARRGGVAPDIMLLGTQWPERALLRAQLIEEGYEVVAVDEWPIPRLYRTPEMKPRLLVVDLHELPDPGRTLEEVRFLFSPDRVLVVTAWGTVSAAELQHLGFHTITRPVTVGDIVGTAARLMDAGSSPGGHTSAVP